LKYLQSCHGMQTPDVEMDVVLQAVYDSPLFLLFHEALQWSWEIKFLFPYCEQRFNIIIAVIIINVTCLLYPQHNYIYNYTLIQGVFCLLTTCFGHLCDHPQVYKSKQLYISYATRTKIRPRCI
jgi:hypothetical protein